MTDEVVAVSSRPRRTRRALFGALGVGVVVAALIGVLATRSVAPQTVASTALLGHNAPAIGGAEIGHTSTISLKSLRGRYVVVAFFASWCAPCTTEAPQLESFLFSHKTANDVAVLGVDIDDSTNNAAAFLQRTGATYPAVEDASGLIAQNYGVEEPPQAYLVNPDGVVFARVLSGVTATSLDHLISLEKKTVNG